MRRRDQSLFLAGRFAAKEAVIKVLTGHLECRPAIRQIEIINEESGKPRLLLPPAMQEPLRRFDILVSIAHERQNAVAVAVLSTRE